MEIFETNLAGTDGLIDGLVSTTTNRDSVPHYTFSSIDGSLVIEIYKDEHGHWKRVSGTDPYLSGWVDELGDQIDQRNSPAY
ncbi:MAG: hypothetical protein EOP42_00645 [Sphingobacteriaceae bacterium]|nr:MAG: hypothetical protein EOP42_00645 [Sphingobacteriaceae bacterium]